MKKSICILVVFLISGAATLYGKKIGQIILGKPENKTVRFSVYAGTDYSAPLYNRSRAKVILTICRFANNKQQIVWQEVIDNGKNKNYPASSKPLYREVSVYNVFDRTETLAAYYEVIYNTKGSKMSYVQGIPLSQGSKADSLQISI